MTASVLSWLDTVFEAPDIEDALSTHYPRRGSLQFTGGVAIADDPVNDATVVTVETNVATGTGFVLVVGGVASSSAAPVNLGDSSQVTGTLPAADQQAQALAFPLGGTTSAPILAQIPGVLPFVTGLGTTTIALSALQASYQAIRFSGPTVSPVSVIYPAPTPDLNGASGGVVAFVNLLATTLTFTVAGKTPSVTVPAGAGATCVVDATGVFLVTTTAGP